MKRAPNLAAAVFVFEGKRKPYTTRVVYLDHAHDYKCSAKWTHVATLEPASWIEALMNHPKERQHMIEGLMANVQGHSRGEKI